ncbi:hypothetical protein QEN19_001879 [Hanseniaspora menglaensis]
MYIRHNIETAKSFLFKRNVNILALEYSCDDSCVSILNDQGAILFNKKITSSHVCESGGVIPIKAIHHHQKTLPVLVQTALKETNMTIGRDITMICATRGPGLAGSLCTGYQFSKGLAVAHTNVKFQGVHHMLGHLLMSSLEFPNILQKPFLSLLVSGGHTQLVLSESVIKHDILIDLKEKSAIGDSLDKCGRMLGFRGDMIAKEMEAFLKKNDLPLEDPMYYKQLTKTKFSFKFPLNAPSNNADIAFSFSGQISQLKQFLEREKIDLDHLDCQKKAELVYQVQYLHFYHLIKKLKQLFELRPDISNYPLVISGGVAANTFLRKYLQKEFKTDIYFPQRTDLCTDNAVMIGWGGLKFYEHTKLLTKMDSITQSKWLLSDILSVGGYEKDKGA